MRICIFISGLWVTHGWCKVELLSKQILFFLIPAEGISINVEYVFVGVLAFLLAQSSPASWSSHSSNHPFNLLFSSP